MLIDALVNALKLIFSFEHSFYEIILLSLFVSLSATLLGGILGIPLGTFLGLKSFPGRGLIVRWLYVFMGLPPVLAGLIVFLFLSRSGPIAEYIYLLYTPTAMIIAQTLLVTPIVVGLVQAVVKESAHPILLTAKGLGASKWQAFLTLLSEIRLSIIAALVTAFGRAIAEVGAVMMVGGDIEGQTRVLTTSIVLETRKGNFDVALALGIVLLIVSFTINSLLYYWQNGVINETRFNKGGRR